MEPEINLGLSAWNVHTNWMISAKVRARELSLKPDIPLNIFNLTRSLKLQKLSMTGIPYHLLLAPDVLLRVSLHVTCQCSEMASRKGGRPALDVLERKKRKCERDRERRRVQFYLGEFKERWDIVKYEERLDEGQGSGDVLLDLWAYSSVAA